MSDTSGKKRPARAWSAVREEALRRGQITEEGVARARGVHVALEKAYALREVRRLRAVTQETLATQMKVSQPRISAIERGELSRTEIGTLKAYVEALGGKLRVVADFEDRTVTLDDEASV